MFFIIIKTMKKIYIVSRVKSEINSSTDIFSNQVAIKFMPHGRKF